MKLNNIKISNLQGKLLEVVPGTTSRLFEEYFQSTDDLDFISNGIIVSREERHDRENAIGVFTCKLLDGGVSAIISPRAITFASGSISLIVQIRDFLYKFVQNGRVQLLP